MEEPARGRRGNARAGFVLAAACALLGSPQLSRAELGDLTPQGCVQETGGTSCNGSGGTAPGLAGVIAVVVAPGGNDLYAASFDDHAIAWFERDPDGSITTAGCIQETGGTDCIGIGGTAPGLEAASDVEVSPDGKSVYVVSSVGNAIVEFTRAPDGSLASAECIHDSSSSALCGGGGISTPGLRGASALAVSPDGENVYVASVMSDAITVFDRAANGSLTPAGCIQNTGRTECAALGGSTAPGLDGAHDVAVSPDGNSVYVVSLLSDAIAVFEREPDGSLTPAGCIEDTDGLECAVETPALDGPRAVTVSPDGDSVYVAAFNDDAVLTFDRAPNGSLTPAGCIQDTDGDNDCTGTGGTTEGMNGPSAVVVSADGENVYVASTASDAIVSFERGNDGTLTPAGCIQNTGRTECTEAGGSTTAGLEGAIDVTMGRPGGANVYVASYNSSAIVVFDREAPPVTTTTTTTTTTTPPPTECGDANGDGDIKANDALAILKAAVGGNQCDAQPCICDVAGGGSVLSSDALAALRIAVGLDVEPNCSC